MARTVFVTPAQRRAAEALVEWYEATKQPVANAVRQIAASEPWSRKPGPGRSAGVEHDGSSPPE